MGKQQNFKFKEGDKVLLVTGLTATVKEGFHDKKTGDNYYELKSGKYRWESQLKKVLEQPEMKTITK